MYMQLMQQFLDVVLYHHVVAFFYKESDVSAVSAVLKIFCFFCVTVLLRVVVQILFMQLCQIYAPVFICFLCHHGVAFFYVETEVQL